MDSDRKENAKFYFIMALLGTVTGLLVVAVLFAIGLLVYLL